LRKSIDYSKKNALSSLATLEKIDTDRIGEGKPGLWVYYRMIENEHFTVGK
jgi:hypothetical protein